MNQNFLISLFKELNKIEEIKVTNNENLNVFKLISKKCKREEFHSAVIAGLLSSKDNPENGTILMDLFIDCLNQSPDFDNKIDRADFYYYDIEIEKDKIDLLIIGKNEENKESVILIENKINGASDQDNQLPNYYNKLLTRRKDKIDKESIKAIVYLPILYKRPEKWSITPVVEQEINEKLIILPAYDAYQKNYSLIENWFKVAFEKINESDARFILKQYKYLVEIMVKDKITLKKTDELLDFLITKNLYDDFLDAQNCFNRVPEVLADKCNLFPFHKFYKKINISRGDGRKKDDAPYFKCQSPQNKATVIPEVIRFSFKQDKSTIHFWPKNSGNGDLTRIEMFLESWDIPHGFKKKSNDKVTEYYRDFAFPAQYEEMNLFVEKNLIERLNKITINNTL